MKFTRIISALLYLVICSITVLVMLTTSFELFKEKYLPSFMLAQKFALPIIISAMAVAYLTFFEPERMADKRTMLYIKIGSIIILGIVAFYVFTIDHATASTMTLVVYWVQLAATTFVTIGLFFKQQ